MNRVRRKVAVHLRGSGQRIHSIFRACQTIGSAPRRKPGSSIRCSLSHEVALDHRRHRLTAAGGTDVTAGRRLRAEVARAGGGAGPRAGRIPA